jgi:hypothetical protein
MNNLTNDQLFQVCLDRDNIRKRIEEGTLTTISIKHLEEVPSVTGIYFVMTEAKDILYIGMSGDLGKRCDIRSHHKLPQALEAGAKYIAIAKVDFSTVEHVEMLLIKEYQPVLNVMHNVRRVPASPKLDQVDSSPEHSVDSEIYPQHPTECVLADGLVVSVLGLLKDRERITTSTIYDLSRQGLLRGSYLSKALNEVQRNKCISEKTYWMLYAKCLEGVNVDSL